jgi:hypothetical protein
MHSTHDDRLESIAREDLLAWGTVRAGLALTFIGSLLAFISFFVLIAVMLSVQARLQGGGALPVLVVMYASLGWVAGIILCFSGACMSSAAPQNSGAKGWGIGTCIFSLLSLALFAVVVLVAINVIEQREKQEKEKNLIVLGDPRLTPPREPFSPQEARLIGYGFQGTWHLGVICYVLFLRAIASHFRRDGLAVGVVVYLIVYVLFMAGVNVLAHSDKPPVANLEQLQTLAWVIAGGIVILAVWGIVLVGVVRAALTEGLVRPPSFHPVAQ